MSFKIPSIKLNNGMEMPIIGFGTYSRKKVPGLVKQAVEDAIDIGYRLFDTAPYYKNEGEIGEAISNKIKQGVVKREDVQIATKLGNNCHAEDLVVPAIKRSLQNLKVDYVDIYLMHWPFSANKEGEDLHIDYVEAWRGMEKAVDLGLTRTIGVCNFNQEQVARLLQHARIKPAIVQIEINPTFPQHKMVAFLQQNSVQPMAYTPFGLLSDARPEFAGKDVIKTDPMLGQLAAKYGKTRTQIALRYLAQRGIAMIPKTFTTARMIVNAAIFDFELTPEDVAVVESYNINHRCVAVPAFKNMENYPFTEYL